jgi:hypothetical protein
MISEFIASLRQYAADPPGGAPTLKYEDGDLRRIIVRAISLLPQLQTPRDGQYIRSRDAVSIFFDGGPAFINPVNVTLNGHLGLTDITKVGSVDRIVSPADVRADFADLLFAYIEAKDKGASTDGALSIDMSLDGGTTLLVKDGYEASLPVRTYLDVSSYAKTALSLRFSLGIGSRKVDSAQLYLVFLKRSYLLDYAASVENAAKYIITEDLRSEAIRKGYDLTVINALAMAAHDLLRMATGRTETGEPLEKPQSRDPGLGMKTSQLRGSGREGTDRTAIEDTGYGKSVGRVFG